MCAGDRENSGLWGQGPRQASRRLSVLAAASIACQGLCATTPTKFLRTTTFTTPAISLTELSSTLTTVAPTAGGRTTRPCSIPGSRTLCTYSSWPVAIAGMSVRPIGLPSKVHSRGGLRLAFLSSVRLSFLPPTSWPYVIFFEASVRAPTRPSAAVSWSTGIARCSDAIFEQCFPRRRAGESEVAVIEVGGMGLAARGCTPGRG